MKRYNRYFNEARSHADKNPFIGAWDYLLEYKDDPDVYISFTEIDKIGINPRSKFNTPIGVYCYPLKEFVTEYLYTHPHDSDKAKEIRQSHRIGFFAPFAGNSKYINFIKLKSGANFVDDMYSDYGSNNYDRDMKILEKQYKLFQLKNLDKLIDETVDFILNDVGVFELLHFLSDRDYNLSYNICNNLLNDVKKINQNKKTIIQKVSNTLFEFNNKFNIIIEEGIKTVKEKNPVMSMWNVTRLLAKELTNSEKAASTKWNMILRKDLGYAGFGDKSGKGYIHPSEPMQAVFLDPKAFKVLHRVENKSAKSLKNLNL